MNANFFYKRELLVILVLFFVTAIADGEKIQNNEPICSKYNSPMITWTCKAIDNCSWTHNIADDTKRERRCGSDLKMDKICCPERKNVTSSAKSTPRVLICNSTPSRTRVSSTTSPSQKDYHRIVHKKCVEHAKARYATVCHGGDLIGSEEICEEKLDCRLDTSLVVPAGRDVSEKEFPHMALIGFGDDVNNITWPCTGSLISDRFILSAAHCTHAETNRHIRWAALGLLWVEQATAEKFDKNIFRIARTHNHPNYKVSKANFDIALHELEHPVKFSLFIRPICLHTENIISKEEVNNTLGVGWIAGPKMSISDYGIQKEVVNVLPKDSCARAYANERRLDKGFDARTMICAANLGRGTDVCLGESGAAVQINHKEECMYLQVGIISLGERKCGIGSPIISTRVSAYLDWIVETVWPNEV